MNPLSPDLLALLVCPAPECRGTLAPQADRLVCATCRRRYRLTDRWAVLIPDEAEPDPSPPE